MYVYAGIYIRYDTSYLLNIISQLLQNSIIRFISASGTVVLTECPPDAPDPADPKKCEECTCLICGATDSSTSGFFTNSDSAVSNVTDECLLLTSGVPRTAPVTCGEIGNFAPLSTRSLCVELRANADPFCCGVGGPPECSPDFVPDPGSPPDCNVCFCSGICNGAVRGDQFNTLISGSTDEACGQAQGVICGQIPDAGPLVTPALCAELRADGSAAQTCCDAPITTTTSKYILKLL